LSLGGQKKLYIYSIQIQIECSKILATW